MEPEGVGDAAMFINIHHHYIITLTLGFQSASVALGGENHDEWTPLPDVQLRVCARVWPR